MEEVPGGEGNFEQSDERVSSGPKSSVEPQNSNTSKEEVTKMQLKGRQNFEYKDEIEFRDEGSSQLVKPSPYESETSEDKSVTANSRS